VALKLNKVYLGSFFSFLLTGCGIDTENISVGNVTLGGTGMPTVGSTPIKPTPTDLFYPEDSSFILWTAGEIEETCENINLKIQIKDLATGDILRDGEGILLDSSLDADKKRIGAVITVTNLNPDVTTEFLENCQFSIDATSEDGESLLLEQDLECTSGDMTISHKSNEPTIFQKDFNVPNKVKVWNFNYHHIYAFKQDATFIERKSCDISYPLNVSD